MSLSLDAIGLVHPNGQRALQRVTLAATAGERLAIIGPSGAGKTTLLRVAAASLRPSEGRLRSLESNPWQLSARALRRLRARIGVVHQAPPIPPRLRVVTAVLAGRLGAWSPGRALASLLYPADIAGARVAALSGRHRRRGRAPRRPAVRPLRSALRWPAATCGHRARAVPEP